MNESTEVLIERMTWPDIEQAIASGKRAVIVVAGSSEQHGPHLGESTDAVLGEEIACRIETGYVGPVDVPALLRAGLKSITPNGILGDPVGSRPEIGEAVFESVVNYLQAQVAAGDREVIQTVAAPVRT